MQRFKNILFVADGRGDTDVAFGRAVRLAQTNKAKLTIICVQREINRNLPNLQSAIIRQQQERLKSFSQKVNTKGVKVKVKVVVGIPFVEVIKAVISDNHDLVIKSAEGRGGLQHLLFGSTDWHLMRKCPAPVWIMKKIERKRVSRILAAVDPDPEVETNEELNVLVLDLATSLASREKSELHVVHAWSVPNEDLLRSGRISSSSTDADRLIRETKKAHKEWLSDLLAKYDLSDVSSQIHLLKGDAADVIPAVATKTNAELVIIGTVARTGIPGFLIGNTAEKTLGNLNCSVLTAKPKSFKTPIQP